MGYECGCLERPAFAPFMLADDSNLYASVRFATALMAIGPWFVDLRNRSAGMLT